MDVNPTPEEAEELRVSDAVEAMKGCQSSYYTVVVEGREIPKMRMTERNGMVSLQLDGRWEIDLPPALAPQVAWMVANALAVGQGYAHLGSPNKERPFAPEVFGLSSSLLTEKDQPNDK